MRALGQSAWLRLVSCPKEKPSAHEEIKARAWLRTTGTYKEIRRTVNQELTI